MQSLIVQKYGGTTMGSAERIRAVAQKISQDLKKTKSLVVVVSAMGHSTDALHSLAEEVSPTTLVPGQRRSFESLERRRRELDMLLTTGERVSMSLLSLALADLKVEAVSFTGSQTGIITDETHGRARIKKILGDRVRQALANGQVAIVAGFQGVSENKEITTLGRGGSDTTAVALSAALGAECCEIYTDVDGVFSANPKTVKEAKLLPHISYETMIDYAYGGALVLHPRCIELAMQYGVKILVKNPSALNNNHQTEVGFQTPSRKEYSMSTTSLAGFAGENSEVVGVASGEHHMLLQLELARPTVLGSIWDEISKRGLSVSSPIFQGTKVWFFVERASEEEWKSLLELRSAEGFLSRFDFHNEIGSLTIAGSGFSQDPTVLNRAVEVLASDQIFATLGTASSFSVTLAVPINRLNEAVQTLHRTFLGEGKSH